MMHNEELAKAQADNKDMGAKVKPSTGLQTQLDQVNANRQNAEFHERRSVSPNGIAFQAVG